MYYFVKENNIVHLFFNYLVFGSRWLCSTNHKDMGLLYMWVSLFGGGWGSAISMYIRLELSMPGEVFVLPDTQVYNVFVTAHGLLMIFFFVMPILMGGYGNFMVPLTMGAPEMAFPSLNNLGFWLLAPSLFMLLWSLVMMDGPGVGWTLYPLLSGLKANPGPSMDACILSLHMAGVSSMVGAMNFMVTIVNMSPMETFSVGLFVYAVLMTAVLLVLTLPVLGGALVMLMTDRNFGTTFFDPTGGGDPVLYQHIFWFFGHPEVYILIMPAFGMTSAVMTGGTNREVFGYECMVYAMMTMASMGSIVWGHHMFTAGLDADTRVYFMTVTMLMALPSGAKVYGWLSTILFGLMEWKVSLYYCVGFMGMFTIGGTTGMFLANGILDMALHDTYYVVAHFHYVLSMGSVFGVFAGFYHWCLLFFGVKYPEIVGKSQFWLNFVGVNLTFGPMHLLGMAGMPSSMPDYPDAYTVLNFWCTVGALFTFFGFFTFILMFSWMSLGMVIIFSLSSVYKVDFKNKFDSSFISKFEVKDEKDFFIFALNSMEKFEMFMSTLNVIIFSAFDSSQGFLDVTVVPFSYISKGMGGLSIPGKFMCN